MVRSLRAVGHLRINGGVLEGGLREDATIATFELDRASRVVRARKRGGFGGVQGKRRGAYGHAPAASTASATAAASGFGWRRHRRSRRQVPRGKRGRTAAGSEGRLPDDGRRQGRHPDPA